MRDPVYQAMSYFLAKLGRFLFPWLVGKLNIIDLVACCYDASYSCNSTADTQGLVHTPASGFVQNLHAVRVGR